MLNMEHDPKEIIARKTRLRRKHEINDKYLDDETKEDFLQLIALGHTKSAAAKQLKFPIAAFTEARVTDADFDNALERANAEQADLIEQVALDRTLNGVEKPVWFQGEQVGEDTVYDNNLLITMLKAAKPEKYKDRKEVSGSGGIIELQITNYGGKQNANVEADQGPGDEEVVPRPEEPRQLGTSGEAESNEVGPDIQEGTCEEK